jgi:hypothetical protein
MTYVRTDVDGNRTMFCGPCVVAGACHSVCHQLGVVCDQLSRQWRATIRPGDVGRHPLVDLAWTLWLAPQVGMRVHVDEPRCNTEAAGVEDAVVARSNAADRRDAIAADADVCDESCLAGAVEDGAAAQHEVELRRERAAAAASQWRDGSGRAS